MKQVSGDVLQVSDGSLYPALHKLEQEGWISAKWKASENNRRAKFYSLTRLGRRELNKEAAKVGAALHSHLARGATQGGLRGGLLRRQQADQEPDEALQYHVEQKTQDYIAAGLPPREARQAALREWRGVEHIKEECQDMRGAADSLFLLWNPVRITTMTNGQTMHTLPGSPQFPTTRWTLVIAAGDPHRKEARSALVSLCEGYWYPLYAYLRRRGDPADQAQDLTQEFFIRVLEGRYLDRADPEKGRFRAFLLTSLKFFVADEEDRLRAHKRGGGAVVQLEFSSGEQRYQREPAHEETPERIFERW